MWRCGCLPERACAHVCVQLCSTQHTHTALAGRRFVIHHFFYLSLSGGLVRDWKKHIQYVINCSLTRVTGLMASFFNQTNQHQLMHLISTVFQARPTHLPTVLSAVLSYCKLYSIRSKDAHLNVHYCVVQYSRLPKVIFWHCMWTLVLWFCVMVSIVSGVPCLQKERSDSYAVWITTAARSSGITA